VNFYFEAVFWLPTMGMSLISLWPLLAGPPLPDDSQTKSCDVLRLPFVASVMAAWLKVNMKAGASDMFAFPLSVATSPVTVNVT
jgi:hypothetical protein